MLFSVLNHKVDCDKTERTTFALPAMHKHCAVFLAGLLDEADNGVDDCLIDDILDGIFSPVKGEKGHALDD